eukprot:432589_1
MNVKWIWKCKECDLFNFDHQPKCVACFKDNITHKYKVTNHNESNGKWMFLSKFISTFESNMCYFNETEFLIATTKTIFKYNSKSNTWSNYHGDSFNSNSNSLIFDSTSNQLLLYGINCSSVEFRRFSEDISKLSIIDIKTGELTIDNTVPRCGGWISLILADNSCHIIGGDRNKHHWMCNKDKYEFKLNYTFDWNVNSLGGNYWNGVIYVKSRQQILFFGGWRSDEYQCSDVIYIYSLTENKWSVSDTNLPIQVQYFGSILTPDERFIILFGGWTFDDGNIDDIWIWNLEEMNITKSKLVCPDLGGYSATLLFDTVSDILIYGYLKEYCNQSVNIPYDIINIIGKWCYNCLVHLMDRDNGNHWKIELAEILK